MKSPIYRHVARPVRFLYCAPSLIGVQLVAGPLLAIVLGTPLGAVGLWLITYPLCILISMREPHIEAVMRALPERRPTRNHWQSDDRTYVA
ncbi:MAG TPA: hypothetical protein VND94_19015 [Terriglobia bacterium]|nr:hypothetical protein [Terriglobia bacterium]